MQDREVRLLVARAESLLDEMEALEDTKAKSVAIEAVQVLLELYGEGLLRILNLAEQQNETGLIARFKQDELVSHLLLLHGLHPDDMATRVQRALDEVRPYMESHGGNVELLSVEGGVARLRLVGSCHGCMASSTTMKLAVEKAVQKHAPDLMGIEADGAVEPPTDQKEGFVPVSALKTAEVLKQHV